MAASYSIDRLLPFIKRAKHAVAVKVNAKVSTSLIETCISLVEAGLAVELLLNKSTTAVMEDNPFLLGKCLQLIKKGAAIFLIPPDEGDRIYECIIDFAEIHDIYAENVISYQEEDHLAELQNRVYDFQGLKAEPFLVEQGDILINLQLSERAVLKGDSAKVSWEVDSADRIVIQGIGDVGPYGSKNLKFQRSTIIKIGAYNARQSQVRALKVWVSEELKITYDIGFMSKQSHEYYSLVQAENYPHAYGVSLGNTIRFSWEAADADEIKILPFDIKTKKGEHTFSPTESMIIEIRAQIQERVLKRKITLLVFPIPVFKDKLVPLLTNIDSHDPFPIPDDLQNKLGLHARSMLRNEEKRYDKLRENILKHHKRIQSKKINFKRVNSFLFSAIKRAHSRKSGVVDILQSIQDYYNNPRYGN
ncbi:MAG: hypothetical protein AAGG59_13595 [Bacteroidota bacterium]